MTDARASDPSDGVGTSADLGELSRGRGAEFVPPRLTGRLVYLRPIMPEDYGFLRAMELGPDLGVRWRFRGTTPSVEQWVRDSGAPLVTFLAIRSKDHRPLGLVTAYNHSFQDQFAYVAMASFQPGGRSPLMMAGAALFLDYTFTCWPFRKLYAELPEYNLPQFAAASGTLLEEEGRLRDHVFYDGRYWDVLILSLYRETWERRAARFLAASLPAPERSARVSLRPAR